MKILDLLQISRSLLPNEGSSNQIAIHGASSSFSQPLKSQPSNTYINTLHISMLLPMALECNLWLLSNEYLAPNASNSFFVSYLLN